MLTFKTTRQVDNPDFTCAVSAKLITMRFVSYNVANTVVIAHYCKLSQKSIGNRLTYQQICAFLHRSPFHAMSGSASSQHDLPPVNPLVWNQFDVKRGSIPPLELVVRASTLIPLEKLCWVVLAGTVEPRVGCRVRVGFREPCSQQRSSIYGLDLDPMAGDLRVRPEKALVEHF
ncbi:hypothetical protein TNCV_3578941 [Trichonephila clavipes]|nr:hypothetical protein TNCV_3578941 [Trichonephila clavipes]